MSVIAMAEAAIDRRNRSESSSDAQLVPRKPMHRSANDADPGSEVTHALKKMEAYIPVEIVGVYIVVVSALGQESTDRARWIAFGFFLLFAPCAVWLVFATKVKSRGEPIPIPFVQWPLWEMITATLAFLVWAYALAGTPFETFPWYSSALAGVIALVASMILGLVSPLFENPLPATSTHEMPAQGLATQSTNSGAHWNSTESQQQVEEPAASRGLRARPLWRRKRESRPSTSDRDDSVDRKGADLEDPLRSETAVEGGNLDPATQRLALEAVAGHES